jgi:hypothetical protein
VSFGVTEIQPGDTPDSMLRRADRALLEAKRMGRNAVVQLGDGLGDPADRSAPATSAPCADGELFIERALVTTVPLNVAIEKLRGFVADYNAEVVAIKADRVELQIDVGSCQPARRRSDRPIPFLVELQLGEQRVPATSVEGRAAGQLSRTRVRLAVRLKRARDRRNADIVPQAHSVVAAIKSYLMASEETAADASAKTRPASNVLVLWLKKPS